MIDRRHFLETIAGLTGGAALAASGVGCGKSEAEIASEERARLAELKRQAKYSRVLSGISSTASSGQFFRDQLSKDFGVRPDIFGKDHPIHISNYVNFQTMELPDGTRRQATSEDKWNLLPQELRSLLMRHTSLSRPPSLSSSAYTLEAKTDVARLSVDGNDPLRVGITLRGINSSRDFPICFWEYQADRGWGDHHTFRFMVSRGETTYEMRVRKYIDHRGKTTRDFAEFFNNKGYEVVRNTDDRGDVSTRATLLRLDSRDGLTVISPDCHFDDDCQLANSDVTASFKERLTYGLGFLKDM